MRVGLVTEGRTDLAVLVNILKGKLGLDRADLVFIRPEHYIDETDSYEQPEAQLGGWGRVRGECMARDKIRAFLNSPIDDEFLVVIHIDTAEADQKGYDVERPRRGDPDYTEVLRQRVVERINTWLEGEDVDRVRYAVAVEEIDAWILTIHSTKDTAAYHDPKKKLQEVISKNKSEKERKQHFQLKPWEQANALTQPFRKLRELEKFAGRNRSLWLFVESLRSLPGAG